MKTNPTYSNSIMQQARMTPGASPNNNSLAHFAMGYYLSLNNTSGGQATPAQLIQTNSYNQMMQYVDSNPVLKKQFTELIQNPRTHSNDMIDFLSRNGLIDESFANNWKTTTQFVKAKK